MLTEPISKPTFSAAVSLKGLIVDLFFSLGTNGFMTSQSWERHSRLRWLHLNLFFYGSVWYFTSFSSIIYENAFSKREDRTPCLSSLAKSFSRPFSGTWPQCFPANFVCAVCSRHFSALPPPSAHRYTQGVSSVSQAQKWAPVKYCNHEKNLVFA